MALSQEAKDRALVCEQGLQRAYIHELFYGDKTRAAGIKAYRERLSHMRIMGNLGIRFNPDGTPAEIISAEDDDVSQLVGHIESYLG